MTTLQMTAPPVAARTPQKRRRGRPQDAAGPFTYVVLGFTALLFVAPFYYMIVAASRPMAEMNTWPPPLLPGGDLWRNVRTAVDSQNIGLALWNSFGVSGITTVGTVLFCTLAGFAFAKMRFRGRNLLFGITLGTMMIPPTICLPRIVKTTSTGRVPSRVPAMITDCCGT